MFDRDETLAEARERNIRDALFEDIGRTDWTSRLIPADRRLHAVVRVRESAVLCGRDCSTAACARSTRTRASTGITAKARR
jgi:nicotinate-nucleotide pyrophosphorylase (carboxylating)